MSNDIDVKIGADVNELGRGMDKAASVVRDKTGQIAAIMRKHAEEQAAIAREQARVVEEQARKQAEAVERIHKQNADRMGNIGRELQGSLTSMLSLGAIIAFVNSTKQAVTEAEASYRGLESVANYTGVGIGNAMKAAGQLAADGLMTTAEASKALQNLLSRGYSLDQAMNTLTRLKDAAAFNRQANLEMGEAVVNATEGLKNENSLLVDNAGVTKNVAKMWDEYAAKIGKSANELTTAEKIQAEYNGVMAETEAQVGNAAKASEGLQGKTAQMTAKFQDLKIMLGERLTPAFTMLADVASWLMQKFDIFIRLIQISGVQIAKWGMDVGAVFSAVSNWDFSNLRAQLDSNASVMLDMVDDIMAAKPGSSFAPSPDSGKRKGPDAPPADKPAKGGKGGKAKKADAPDDVFDNGSFVTSSKDTASFIRDQFAAVNSLQSEMAAEAQRAAKATLDANEKAAQGRAQAEIIGARATINARMSVVDADEEAARRRLNLGLTTREQLLEQEMEFAQRRHQIKLDALAMEESLINPESDPEAYAELKAEIEAVEQQHQLNMTEIKNAAELERNQYTLGAMSSIQSSMAQSMQQLMMGQIKLSTFFKQVWSGVLSAITGEIAKFAAKWIMEKIKMMVFGKAAATSQIATAAALAGANGVASWALAPWPVNVGAPAFGAAMSAAAMAFAPVAAASQGFDIPAGVNPITQLHQKEMVLPAEQADVIRGMAGGESGGGGITVNISAIDGNSVRDLFMNNGHHLASALREQARGFNS